jgi:hypothetical protein
MKPEIAVRLAGSLVAEITTEQAQEIVNEYLAQLARCSACDGTGRFTYGHEITVPIDPRAGEPATMAALAGADGDCPRCGGHGSDPEWVAWRCLSGGDERQCKYEAGRDTLAERHAHCGLRLILPLPKAGK